MKYIIATRGSRLALFQANYVRDELRTRFPEHEWEIQTFTTTGDRFLDKPLSNFGGKGAFLKEIEEAMLAGKADIAVHSLKDVPGIETPGLRLCAFLPREDPRDVWVSLQEGLMELPAGKRVGTSSLRRSVLLHFYRNDLPVELLRGNLDTRLRKLREGMYDAIVLAAAGLHRLQLFDESCMQYLKEDAFIPAIGQGIMVVQVREGSPAMDSVRQLNDSESETAARVERSFLMRYEGGCQLPLGGYARRKNGSWLFRGFIGGIKSLRMIQAFVENESPDVCAVALYEELERQGARELLAEL